MLRAMALNLQSSSSEVGAVITPIVKMVNWDLEKLSNWPLVPELVTVVLLVQQNLNQDDSALGALYLSTAFCFLPSRFHQSTPFLRVR